MEAWKTSSTVDPTLNLKTILQYFNHKEYYYSRRHNIALLYIVESTDSKFYKVQGQLVICSEIKERISYTIE